MQRKFLLLDCYIMVTLLTITTTTITIIIVVVVVIVIREQVKTTILEQDSPLGGGGGRGSQRHDLSSNIPNNILLAFKFELAQEYSASKSQH